MAYKGGSAVVVQAVGSEDSGFASTSSALLRHQEPSNDKLSPASVPIDFGMLEKEFKGLAYATRLQLLSVLREPHTLEEMKIFPGPAQASDRPDRLISRQAVKSHIDRLMEVGLVVEQPRKRKGRRRVPEYVVNRSRLYAIIEEFRKLSAMAAGSPYDPTATEALVRTQIRAWAAGPKVVLVHGVREGKTYPLSVAALEGDRGWVIGRSGDVSISLDYDPYISSENSEILRDADGSFRLLDLRTAKNGTFLNWEQLPVGGEAPLECGDIIGCGRSLLVFRQD